MFTLFIHRINSILEILICISLGNCLDVFIPCCIIFWLVTMLFYIIVCLSPVICHQDCGLRLMTFCRLCEAHCAIIRILLAACRHATFAKLHWHLNEREEAWSLVSLTIETLQLQHGNVSFHPLFSLQFFAFSVSLSRTYSPFLSRSLFSSLCTLAHAGTPFDSYIT